MEWLKGLGKPFMQGGLALVGFTALTWGFIDGKVPVETYVPLVSLMVGFFFQSNKGS